MKIQIIIILSKTGVDCLKNAVIEYLVFLKVIPMDNEQALV